MCERETCPKHKDVYLKKGKYSKYCPVCAGIATRSMK